MKTQPHSPRKSGTVAIVGRPNVGKSTLLNAALGQPIAIVSPVAQTTRHRVLGVVRWREAELILLDTPGIHKPESRLGRALNRTARATSEEADVVVYVTDARPPPAGGAASIHPGDKTLLADIGARSPTILVVNKVDLVSDKTRLLPLLEELGRARDFAAVVPISALESDGVDRVLDEVAALVPERAPQFGEDEITDMPSRFFASEFVREQILQHTQDEVPHATAVKIERFEERGDAIEIDATIIVMREGQKKILIGKSGSMLKEIGTKARARIEELLEAHVRLSLWVKVSPDWTESPTALVDFGYEVSR